MKANIRVVGIDDAPFKFDKDSYTDIFGVVMRAQMYVEGIMHDIVSIDKGDATEVITSMINRSRYKTELRSIILDGIAVGGFNIIDIDSLYTNTGIGVIVFTRHMPNMLMIEKALRKRFQDWQKRLSIIRRYEIHKIHVPLAGKHHEAYIQVSGISIPEATEIIRKFTYRAVIPEPIRIAHFIGAALKKGESRGHA